jgi:hypothetical protein
MHNVCGTINEGSKRETLRVRAHRAHVRGDWADRHVYCVRLIHVLFKTATNLLNSLLMFDKHYACIDECDMSACVCAHSCQTHRTDFVAGSVRKRTRAAHNCCVLHRVTTHALVPPMLALISYAHVHCALNCVTVCSHLPQPQIS